MLQEPGGSLCSLSLLLNAAQTFDDAVSCSAHSVGPPGMQQSADEPYAHAGSYSPSG